MRAAELLAARGETIAVAEGSCGGLISAALLEVPGASAWFRAGAVVYTGAARKAFLDGEVELPEGLRGASEPWVRYLATSVRARVRTDWGIGEGGAAGPSGNPYGDPAGHAWVAVAGPDGSVATRHLLTGAADRAANMRTFRDAALALLVEQLEAAPPPPR
ncbi:MAG TPA: CinA family protein [Acidimicrobiales bacterium]|nr:CinA family protein [Acidimicrobiales bacterium]